MPASASLARPAAVIQSVVQGGAKTVRISTVVKPAERSAPAMSARMTSMAGQPE